MSTLPVQVFSSFYHEGLVEMGAITLIAYDYLITIDQEVALFWKRNMSGATALYLGTRYIGVLAYSILGTATYAPMSEKSCMGIATAQPAFSIMQYVLFAAFSGLRTLALSKMNYALALVVFVFALGPFVVNVHTMSLGLVGEIVPPFGCAGSISLTQTLAIMGVIVSRSCAIIADTIAITVTWRSTKNAQGVLAGIPHSSIANTLLVNGTIYFLTLLTLNILHLLLTLLSVADGLEPISLVTVFTDPLTNILTCRFLLALQAASQQAVGQGSATEDAHHGGSDTLRFASRMIGSIATVSVPARHGASTLDGEESEEGVPDADDGQGSGELSGGACEDVLVISSRAGDVVEC